jgi:molybdate transport system substrate-binding protein
MVRLLMLLLALLAAPVRAEAPAIAAAASLRYALDEAIAAFAKATGASVRPVYGASGNLVQQIRNGAPFELFLSADEAHVLALAKDGLTPDQGRAYAVGRLVLIAAPTSKLAVDPKLAGLRKGLKDGSVAKIAIANPEVAPYGMRSREALEKAGLWAAVKPKLVFGENIGQTFQFATTGGADGGFVSLSLVKAPDFKGRWALIAEDWHQPLVQRMVLLKGAGPEAKRFHDWLLSPAGQAVLKRHGYAPPPAVR